MVNCCVPGCTNYSAKSKEAGISYHKIPKEKSLRKAWIARLRRDNLPPTENCYVCSEHFTEDCFVSNLKRELVPGQSMKRRLNRDAIPSLFSFAPQPKSRRTLKRREPKEEETQEVSNMFDSCYTDTLGTEYVVFWEKSLYIIYMVFFIFRL